MNNRLNIYFTRDEFACRCGCGFRSVDVELLRLVTDVRGHLGRSVIINSGCRCEAHNRKIKGSSRSKHMFACAADIKVTGVWPREVYDYIDAKYPNQYGLGLHDDFIHVDVRSTKWRQVY